MSSENERLLGLYRKLVELRAVDERLYPLKLKDLVMDGLHPYIGQEAVAVGVCSALRDDDYVVSNHRPQGHALAKGASMRAIFCEMLGRMGGPSNGLGGPMQWIDVDNYFFCGSIVGSGVSYSTGFALASQREGRGRICVCFFGDGAANTGSCHEGMNLASIWKLPLLYVCENNQYGEAMPVKDFVPVPRISMRAASYGIEGSTVDGMDVVAVADATAEAVERIRAGSGPILLETMTYRYRGHYYGDPDNYRTKDEVKEWQKRDPIAQLKKYLLDHSMASDADLPTREQEIADDADGARDWALTQPTASLKYAASNVLAPVAGRDA
jgi:TPP-dependent pyruvate/acetoin dehydrogenase alpha subunit